MVVVIDSGVWISAFQFGGTPLTAIRNAFVYDEIACCDQILTEVQAVLARKFFWRDNDTRALIDEYFSQAMKVEIGNRLHGICRDPKDDMVFECAESAGAKVIVSGDRDILAVGRYRSIYVLTPREYLDRRRLNPSPT